MGFNWKVIALSGLGLLPSVVSRNVFNVLVYTYTAGYRHDSIPTAVQALITRGSEYGISFTNTEDPDKFNDDYLSQFDGLFFIHNTDDVLDDAGKVAFQNYIDRGGNFIAAHAASNCMLHWPTMELTLGSQFAYHPVFQEATIVVLEPGHPSASGLPSRWTVEDEIYYFNHDPRALDAKVVLSVDESTYEDDGDHSPGQGSPHPIAWYMEELKGTNSTGLVGRSWYTGLGHANSSWEDDTFMGHIFGGVTWALESNTTRAMNPNATVGSLGPIYTPPPPAPTVVVDLQGEATSRVVLSLSFAMSTALLGIVWGLRLV